MSLSIIRKQCSLKSRISLAGKGLFTGEKTTVHLHPASEDHGVVFQRIDLPERPIIEAALNNVIKTPRCTIIGKDQASIQTVEHLLAALSACGIDNVLIEIDGPEVPVFDGSSIAFVDAIEQVGLSEQQKSVSFKKVKTPLFWSHGEVHLIALPSDEYRISYTLHYPHSSALGSQFYSVLVNQEQFKKEIASARTFSLYEEIAPLIEKGMIKGGGLENALIIRDNVVVNPDGVRFPDEMVRHKILDVIGDLSFVPPFTAHIIAIRSGHASNHAFAKELMNHFNMENS